MSEFKRPESILVVVYAQNHQVLILQRQDWPDFWQSVTGSLLPDETPYAGAIRELKEETGLTQIQGNLIDCESSEWFDIYPTWLHRYAKGVTRNLEHVFCFKVEKPLPITLSNEHSNYCWVTKKEALTKMISTTNYSAIDKVVP